MPSQGVVWCPWLVRESFRMGAVRLVAECMHSMHSFLRSAASPFHSFVTTAGRHDPVHAASHPDSVTQPRRQPPPSLPLAAHPGALRHLLAMEPRLLEGLRDPPQAPVQPRQHTHNVSAYEPPRRTHSTSSVHSTYAVDSRQHFSCQAVLMNSSQAPPICM